MVAVAIPGELLAAAILRRQTFWIWPGDFEVSLRSGYNKKGWVGRRTTPDRVYCAGLWLTEKEKRGEERKWLHYRKEREDKKREKYGVAKKEKERLKLLKEISNALFF